MYVHIHDLLQATVKWWSSHQQLVSHHGKRILVGREHRHTTPLLRSHVGRGSTNGSARVGGRGVKLGYPKISQQQVGMVRMFFPATQEKVRGFDILVNDSMFVCML